MKKVKKGQRNSETVLRGSQRLRVSMLGVTCRTTQVERRGIGRMYYHIEMRQVWKVSQSVVMGT